MRLSRIITEKSHRNEAFALVKCVERYVLYSLISQI